MVLRHITTNDSLAGANQAVCRLHRALKARGHDSQLLVSEKSSTDDSVVALPLPRSLEVRLRRRWRRFILDGEQDAAMLELSQRPHSHEMFSSCFSPYWQLTPQYLAGVDVIQLNWVSRFLDWPSFFTAAMESRIPIVWRLPDTNAFTGGCLYPNGCERFTDQCGQCPQIAESIIPDFTRQQLALKKRLLAPLPSHRLTLIAQSHWMQAMAARSTLFSRFTSTVIPNGVDSTVFFPVAHRLAKEALGLPTDRPMAIFVGSGQSGRKGLPGLLPFLTSPDFASIDILLVGNHAEFEGQPKNIHRISSTSSPEILRLIYSAADLLLFPSLEDNCPNTMLESLACGTPVLCFDGSGSAELVEEGDTGWSVPCRDFRQFAKKALHLLTTNALSEGRRAKCERTARERFSYERMVDLYEETYRELSPDQGVELQNGATCYK